MVYELFEVLTGSGVSKTAERDVWEQSQRSEKRRRSGEP